MAAAGSSGSGGSIDLGLRGSTVVVTGAGSGIGAAAAGLLGAAGAPGPIDTPIHATWADDLDEAYRWLADQVPLGRIGDADEVARWIALEPGVVVHNGGGDPAGRGTGDPACLTPD